MSPASLRNPALRRAFRRLTGGGAAVAIVLAAGVLSRAQSPPPPPAGAAPSSEETPTAAGPEAGVPSFLKGVDLALPSQDAFRSWPPAEILEHRFWFPWVVPSFRKAQLFDRPVLFVMLTPWSRGSQRFFREVLGEPRVARTVNESFIAVLVDADRRPDIRERYQTGTWPVTALLLPDGAPMLSRANPRGVEMPITAGSVSPDMMLFLLTEGRTYYDRQAASLRESAATWVAREAHEETATRGTVDDAASDQVARWLVGNYDREAGGFGVAAKFLVPGLEEYAAIRAARGQADLLEATRGTISKMLQSPLYDARDGGLHRLSAAPSWGDIQYEKMLEVNAQLARELVFAVRSGGSPELRKALADTSRFIVRVLGRPGGGFYLGQSADPGSQDGGGYWKSPAAEGHAPPIDRLVLAGPNALAGAALLRAGAILEDESLERAGREAVDLVLERSVKPGRGAEHILDVEPDGRRYLETQAAVAFGLVDAYESTGTPRYLEAAKDVVEFARHNLLTPGEATLRDSLPDAMPVGLLANPRHPMRDNAMLARAMVRINALGAADDYREQAASILGGFTGSPTAYAVYGTLLALAVEETLQPPLVVRIESRAGDPKAEALRRAALRLSWPWTVVSTAEKAKGGAVAIASWRGASRRAEDPGTLEREVRELTAAPAAETKR